MIELQEKQRQLTQERQELLNRSDAIKTSSDANEIRTFRTEEMPRRMESIKSLQEEIDGSSEMERIIREQRVAMKADMAPDRVNPFSQGNGEDIDLRSIGQRFVESNAFKARIENYGTPNARLMGDTKLVPIEHQVSGANIKSWTMGGGMEEAIKATMTTSAGIVPFIPRGPRIVPLGQIQPVIADLIPQEQTSVPGGKYLEETTYTNNADRVAEGGTKPEAALIFTERTFGMTKIAVTLPVTDEQLADVPQVRSLIDNRLSLMIRQKEDDFLLNNTAATGFDGFLQKSGVQEYDMTANPNTPIPTAVLSLITSIQNSPGFANVNGIVMNPTDWFSYVTYQITTGAYLVGAPNQTAITEIWGLPIIVTNRMPQGTILLGDFRTYAEILRRQELTIDVGWANDDFLKNLQRVRAEERMVLQIFRANAFGKVLNVPAP